MSCNISTNGDISVQVYIQDLVITTYQVQVFTEALAEPLSNFERDD